MNTRDKAHIRLGEHTGQAEQPDPQAASGATQLHPSAGIAQPSPRPVQPSAESDSESKQQQAGVKNSAQDMHLRAPHGRSQPEQQATQQQMDGAADGPTNQPTNQSPHHGERLSNPADGTTDKPASQSTSQPTDKPASQSTDKLSSQSTSQPTDKPANQPADEPQTSPPGQSAPAQPANAAQLHNQILRLSADLDNMRRRHQQEIAKAHAYGLEKCFRELMPVLDSLSMALDSTDESRQQSSLYQGVDLTRQMFIRALEKFGMEVVDPRQQEAFNPELHEAMTTMPSTGLPPGCVVQVVQCGYRLNQRLLRPARVVVSVAAT